jgi:hypothetical protein
MAGFSDGTEVDLRRAIFRTGAAPNTLAVRANSSAYAVGDRMMLGTSNLNVYECIVAGTSAGSPPAFNTTLGSTTVDGGVTWLTLQWGYPKRPLWVSLHTADPTDAGTGTEVAGGSYVRVQMDPGDANWTAPDATGGVTRNALPIQFPAPTAAWGLIQYFGVWDQQTGGRFIMGGALTNPKSVNNADPAPLFPASLLVFTLD